jgi:hypothetical protein
VNMRGWERWGPVSGLVLCVTWAPMAIAIPRLPDLGSAQTISTFWQGNGALMQGVILSVTVGYLFLLFFLGALVELIRATADSAATGWVVLGSAVMFMTALNIALGLDIAGGLLVDADQSSTYALHAAAFLLAAPAAFAGVAFFVAVAALGFGVSALPRWSAWLAVIGAMANAGAAFGVFGLTGPLNSGNGVIGGIAAPLGMFLVWVFAVCVWWLRQTRPICRDFGVIGQRRPLGRA